MEGFALTENALQLLAVIEEGQGLGGFVQKYFSFIVLGLVMTVGYVVWRMFGSKKPKGGEPTLEESFQQAQTEIRESRPALPKQDEPVAQTHAAPSPPAPKIADPENRKPEQPPLEEA